MTALTLPTLILNRNWTPIATASVKRSLTLLFQGAARVVCPLTYEVYDFEDWAEKPVADTEKAVIAVRQKIKVPEVMVLSLYGGMPAKKLNFTRKNLYKRYGNLCFYCGDDFREKELTIDHILPRSQGGKSGWENCILACFGCNQRKGGRTPKQANMPLLRPLAKPKWSPDALVPIGDRPESWQSFLKTHRSR